MFWLRNKKVKFSLGTLNQSPGTTPPRGLSGKADCVSIIELLELQSARN